MNSDDKNKFSQLLNSNTSNIPYYNSIGSTGHISLRGMSGNIGSSGFSYFHFKRDQLKIKLDVLNTAFNLDIEDYKVYLNLINSDDEANLEIANGLLANLHNNYNITKK